MKYELSRTQGDIKKITIRDGKYCFILNSPIELQINESVSIVIVNESFRYNNIHIVFKIWNNSKESGFLISDDFYCQDGSNKIEIINRINSHPFSGRWSITNDIELSIINCAKIVRSLFYGKELDFSSDYYQTLYYIIEKRNFEQGISPVMCNAEYLIERALIRKKDAIKFNTFSIKELNRIVADINRSYVNYDHRIVEFYDHYILTPDKHEVAYYSFLALQICTVPIPVIRDVLDYQLLKHKDYAIFKTKIRDYYYDLHESLKTIERKEVLIDWIKSISLSKKKNKNIEEGSDKNYSLKAIAIAYKLLNIPIDESNAADILIEFSQFRSTQKLINTYIDIKDLARLRENKSANTKHLRVLKAAERLLSGKKNKSSLLSIRSIITAFQAKCENADMK